MTNLPHSVPIGETAMNRTVVAADRSRSAADARKSTRRSGAGAALAHSACSPPPDWASPAGSELVTDRDRADGNPEDFGLTSDTPRVAGGPQ